MILLDTSVALWLVGDPQRIPARARRTIQAEAESSGLRLSTISLWEIATLIARGRVRTRAFSIAQVLSAVVALPGLRVLDITPEVAAAAATSPDSPADPADRIIAATAHVEGILLVTGDERLRSTGLVRTIW